MPEATLTDAPLISKNGTFNGDVETDFINTNAWIFVHTLGILFGVRYERDVAPIANGGGVPTGKMTQVLADAEETARDVLNIDESDYTRRTKVTRILQKGMLKGAREIRHWRDDAKP